MADVDRQRRLATAVAAAGAPRLPAARSRSTTRSCAGFTKRLVFSSLDAWCRRSSRASLSYEAERRMMRSRSPGFVNTAEARKRIPSAAAVRALGGPAHRHEPVRTCSIPRRRWHDLAIRTARALARRRRGTTDPRRGRWPEAERADRRCDPALDRDGRPTDGPVDEAWYWAAPLLLDQREDPAGTTAWLGRRGLADRWSRRRAAARMPRTHSGLTTSRRRGGSWSIRASSAGCPTT